MRAGADVNKAFEEWNDGVMVCLHFNRRVARALVEEGFRLDRKEGFHASYILLDLPWDEDGLRQRLGEELHAAVQRDDRTALRALLAAADGGDAVRARSDRGWTLMMEAAARDRAALVHELLPHFDLEAVDAQGATVHALAAWNGADAALRALGPYRGTVGRDGRYTALHQAASAGRASTVHLLLEQGPDDGGSTCSTGETPLHRAAAQGHTAVR